MNHHNWKIMIIFIVIKFTSTTENNYVSTSTRMTSSSTSYDDEDDAANESNEYFDENYNESFDSLRTGFNNPLPIFVEEPNPINYIVKSKNVVLTCKAYNALELKFKCSGNIVPTILNYDSHVDPQSAVKFIEIHSEITKDLIEEYFGQDVFQCECYAVSPHGNIKSQPARVEVAYLKKQFLKSPNSLKIELGSRAEFYCIPPIGLPPPTITWLKDGKNVSVVSSAIQLSDDNNRIIIPQVNLHDIGNYTCTAENISGRKISELATLIVYTNGGWSSWSQWYDCQCDDKSSSSGKKRTRSCTSPVPMNGGANCLGPNIQKTFDCVVCDTAKWSNWSEWSSCGYDCVQTRRRTCLTGDINIENYDEYSESLVCTGKDTQTISCRGGTCRIDRTFTETDWPLYVGLVIIFFVCLAFGIILSYGATKSRQLSPLYPSVRTEVYDRNNLMDKPIYAYDIVHSQSTPPIMNYTSNVNNIENTNDRRPLSEHLYAEPHITANYTYTQAADDPDSTAPNYTTTYYSEDYYNTNLSINLCKYRE